MYSAIGSYGINGTCGADVSAEGIVGADGPTGVTVGYGQPGVGKTGICLHSDIVGNGCPGIGARIASWGCWVISNPIGFINGTVPIVIGILSSGSV